MQTWTKNCDTLTLQYCVIVRDSIFSGDYKTLIFKGIKTMKQGRKSRSMGKAAQVFVSLLLVLSMMGTSVFSVSAAGTEDENAQSESAVYMDEAGDNVSEEDGSPSDIPEEDGDVDSDASISMPENDENTSTSDEDESETSPEDDQISLIDEEIPEEETTEEDIEDEEAEDEEDIELLAA